MSYERTCRLATLHRKHRVRSKNQHRLLQEIRRGQKRLVDACWWADILASRRVTADRAIRTIVWGYNRMPHPFVFVPLATERTEVVTSTVALCGGATVDVTLQPYFDLANWSLLVMAPEGSVKVVQVQHRGRVLFTSEGMPADHFNAVEQEHDRAGSPRPILTPVTPLLVVVESCTHEVTELSVVLTGTRMDAGRVTWGDFSKREPVRKLNPVENMPACHRCGWGPADQRCDDCNRSVCIWCYDATEDGERHCYSCANPGGSVTATT